MRIIVILCAMSLLIGGVALMPSSLDAVDWMAQEANDNRPAQQLVEDALRMFEEGIRKHYHVGPMRERTHGYVDTSSYH